MQLKDPDMLAPYTAFGQTFQVPVVTWTNSKEDKPAKAKWDAELWVERGEDLYALMDPKLKSKTVRVVTREAWLAAQVLLKNSP
jgi:hypothetical protein